MKNFDITFSKKIKKNRVLFGIASIILSIISIIAESYTQKFIDNAVLVNTKLITKRFVILIVLFMIIFIFVYIKKYLENLLEKRGNFEGQIFIYKNILKKSISFHSKQETGVLLHNITSDIYESMPWYSYGRLQYNLEILNIFIILIFMIYTEVYLSLLVVILIGLSVLLSNKMSKFLGRKTNEKLKVNSELNQFMIEVVKNIGTVVQLNKESFFARKYEDYIEERYKPIIDSLIVGQALYISQLILSQEIMPFLVLFAGMILTIFGNSTIGITIIMMSLTSRISNSVQLIGDLLPKKHSSIEIYNRIKELYDNSADEEDVNKLPVTSFKKLNIEVNEYTFPNKKDSLLNDINLEIKRGDLISLNGESGKGKTTLINLISRFLPTDGLSGKISYNGEDIEGLKINDYYKHVLQVEQNAVLIEGTLKENLLLGDEYLKEDLKEIIYTCCLENFLNTRGIDYHIKEDGKNISGGEKQRIGLARILLRRPDLLILDEVTSALNEEIREEIVKRIINYKEKYNLTLIAISHNNDFKQYSNKTCQL